MKKTILIIIFTFIHVILTRFLVRFIDATVQIDNDYLQLIISIILFNIVLFLVLRKIYRLVIREKK